MKYGEFSCCGTMMCGDPDRHEAKCSTCGKLGVWGNIQQNDIPSAFEDTPDPFEDALIQPDDPIPPRDDNENLMERFSIAMATMNRYNEMRERQGLPPLLSGDSEV